MKIRIALNTAIRDNYVFFDPEAPIHLNLSNPVGVVNKITRAILRGLKGKTLIDVDNVINIETGELRNIDSKANKEEVSNEIKNNKEMIEEKREELVEEKKETPKRKTKTKGE